MKIAISSTTKNIDGSMDETFGRCPYFIIAEIKDGQTKEIKSIENANKDQPSGAGISAAQLVAENKVEAVITGDVGPRACDVLNQFKIKIYTGKGTVEEVIQNFINNKLEEMKK